MDDADIQMAAEHRKEVIDMAVLNKELDASNFKVKTFYDKYNIEKKSSR